MIRAPRPHEVLLASTLALTAACSNNTSPDIPPESSITIPQGTTVPEESTAITVDWNGRLESWSEDPARKGNHLTHSLGQIATGNEEFLQELKEYLLAEYTDSDERIINGHVVLYIDRENTENFWGGLALDRPPFNYCQLTVSYELPGFSIANVSPGLCEEFANILEGDAVEIQPDPTRLPTPADRSIL